MLSSGAGLDMREEDGGEGRDKGNATPGDLPICVSKRPHEESKLSWACH